MVREYLIGCVLVKIFGFYLIKEDLIEFALKKIFNWTCFKGRFCSVLFNPRLC